MVKRVFLLPKDLLLKIVLIVFLLFHNYILVLVYRPTSALAQWIRTIVINYNDCYYLGAAAFKECSTQTGNLFSAK